MQLSPSRSRRDWIDNLVLIILVLSLIAGFVLRTFGMDWDKGHVFLFHPDERALAYSAINNISFPWPPDPAKLLRPDSPLNPRFFNYGNLPMYMIRASAHLLSFVVKDAWRTENLWLPGRGLSALFDILTVYIAYRLGRKLYGRRVGLLAAVFGSFTVLHIQLAHYLTVDSFLTAFITLSMYFAVDIVRKGCLKASILTGAVLGLAMGTKVSVAPLLASIFVAWGVWTARGASDAVVRAVEAGRLTAGDRMAKAVLGVMVALLAAVICFVAAMPYAIIDWTNFVRSVDEQSRMVRGIADYPYTRQYLNTPIFLYQIWNTVVWGMGIPLGIVAYAGLAFVTIRTLVKRRSEEIVLLSWVLVYFFINGIFQVKFLRYMLPLFPFLAIMGAELLWQLWDLAGRGVRLAWRPTVPIAQAKEDEEDYLQLDDESEMWERQKVKPAKPARKPEPRPARRRARQISVGLEAVEEEGEALLSPTAELEGVAAPGAPVAEAPAALEAPAPPEPAAPSVPEPPQEFERVLVVEPVPDAPAPVQAAEVVAPVQVAPPAPIEEATAPALEPVIEAPPPEPFSWQTVRQAVVSWTRGQKVVAAVMAFVVTSTIFYALAFVRIYAGPHPWITISEWIYRNVPAGSTMAIEHWDDALPLGRLVDGKQRRFEEYRHVEMRNYEDDNQAKLDMIVNNLQAADYIVLATNRLYVTIGRLPERYPITSRYYELLFAEQLGFRLVKTTNLYPSFLGVTIRDDTLVDPQLARPPVLVESQPKGLVINLGKADESFTVYDHPQPMVFQKVERLSNAELRAMFAGTVERAQEYQLKRQARAAARSRVAAPTKTFLLTESERAAQEAGGTYRVLFNPDSLTNRLPVLFWWLVVQISALAVFPVGFVAFGNLRDRGYLVHKTLGLLVVAYLPWLAGSLKILPFGRLSIVLSLLIIAVLSAAIYRQRQHEIQRWLRANRWLILVNEGIFAVAFLAFVYIRMLNPDLWQPWNGGEKPMEFAFLGALARSTYFPPYDPFFAGGYINYYYYGQYVCAVLVRLTGITPAVAFNLIIPLLFALTFGNAFSITYNLVAGLRRMGEVLAEQTWFSFLVVHRSLLSWALAGALFVAVIGNVATVGEVFKGPFNRGATTVKTSIPGVAEVLRTADGIRKAVQTRQRVFDSFNYWNPSRVIPETINEFPYWSFLFADLHPHTIGIPFTLLVLALALSLLKERRSALPQVPEERSSRTGAGAAAEAHNPTMSWLQRLLSGIQPRDVLTTAVMGLAAGSLGAINTWDLPTYLGIILCAIILRGWLDDGRLRLGEVVVRFGVIVALSLAFYMPFYQKYQALASGIGLVRGRTHVGYYLAIYGFFVFAILSYLAVDLAMQPRSPISRLVRLFARRFDDTPVILRRFRLLVQPRESFQVALFGVLVAGLLVVVLALAKQWIMVLLLPILVAAVVLAVGGERQPERIFVLLLIFTGMLVSLGIEIFFLRDWLQGGSAYRMNTIFKFGIQIWVLFALASAAGLAFVIQQVPVPRQVRPVGRTLWYAALAGLLFCVALFPIIGTPVRVNDRFPNARPPVGTLDGTAFMTVGKYSFEWDRKTHQVDLSYDHQALQWLLRNVDGSPVIAEAVLPYYRELGARVSAFTGMPTLVGNQHEQEQRPGDTQVGPRENDARTLYNEPSFERVIPILKKLWVRYIYVGQLEQAIYAPAGLAKFDEAVGTYLDLVYQNPKVKIYRVRDF